jgi:hypothetical protein
MQCNNFYDRVTSVLSPFSGLSMVPQEILNKAAERGTEVHRICGAIMLGLPPSETVHQGYIDSFKKWSDKDFITQPDRFFCDLHQITGECDGIYEEDGELVLFDLKTPLKESKTWPLQGSAYAYLARANGHDISRIEFIKLSRNGDAPVVYKYEENFKLFVSCLEVYREFFKGKGKDIPLQDI